MKHDGPKFCLSQNNRDGAYLSYKSIYLTEKDIHFYKMCADFKKSSKLTNATTVSGADAFCKDENFLRASWVNIGSVIFHELAGINVIAQYSNTILTEVFGEGTEGFNARTGSYLIGLVSFLSSGLSIWTINKYGRRFLLIAGQLGIFVCHTLTGVFIITGNDIVVFIMILLFSFVY